MSPKANCLNSNKSDVLVINMEPIKHIGRLNQPNSLYLEGRCDEVIDELLKDLGWKEEFDEFVKEVKEQQAKI